MTSDERALKDLIGRRSPSHLECVAARDRVLHELRATPGERLTPRIGVTAPPAPRWRTALPVLSLASAAAIILALVTVPIQWDAVPGSDDVAAGDLVRAGDTVRAGDAGRMLTLDDGSRVEMRARSELSIERAADGIGIRLLTGDIIVNAAKQRDGHLYVHTKEMTVAVVGTVFLVKAGEDGSRVAVIEGEVSVREGDTEARLGPGEQISTSPVLAARPVRDDIIWSRNAGAHLAILESFAKGMAQTAGPLVRLTPAQTATAGPEFEEASIRACDPDNMPPTPPGARGGGANSFQMTPGRLYALCMTPAVMVRVAYGFAAMPDGSLSADSRRGRGWSLNQVSGQGANSGIAVRGGPDWARNERYSIEAVAGTEADADTMSGPMFRSLLERRFKLKTHIDTEDVPTWTLAIAPGGLKIKPMPPDGCYENPPPSPGTRSPSSRTLEEVRGGAKPTCGVWMPRDGNGVLIVGGSTLEDFAGRLRSLLAQSRVSDQTGVTDRFNFVFEYIPDDHGSIVSAVARLGLRLEQSRASREFLVIDSIERPGRN